MPTGMSFREDYDAIKLAHPGNIVLYQLRDFYEMFGPDARVASHELNLMLTQRNLPDLGRVAMCGIPGHKLDEYVQKLRDRHDVTVSSIGPDRDKGYISGWIRSGENNRGIAMRLSEALAGRDGTVTLEPGDTADYFASTTSLDMDIQDKFDMRLSMSWDEIAPVLRALWLQELDGFTHDPPQREPVNLEGKLFYQVGDKVAFSFGDHDVSGTIGYIGEIDVRIDTGPYAWSHQTVTRDFFEDAVRHDKRNAGLFTPEVPEQVAPEASPGTATLCPGDKNGLPYDIIVETLHVDEPEQTQPEAAPAAGNFHITDDHLGEGGPKAKYRMNVEAIRTLKQIEAEGRSTTQAEQEILSRYVG